MRFARWLVTPRFAPKRRTSPWKRLSSNVRPSQKGTDIYRGDAQYSGYFVDEKLVDRWAKFGRNPNVARLHRLDLNGRHGESLHGQLSLLPGSWLASFLLGWTTSAQVVQSETLAARSDYYGSFVQDDWKM